MNKLKTAVICALVGQIAAFLFLLLFSFILYRSEDPRSGMAFCAYSVSGLSGAVLGLSLSLFPRGGDLPVFLLSFSLFCAVTLVLSLIPGGDGNGADAILRVGISGLCALAVWLTVGRGKERRSAARRAKRHYRRR